MRTKNNIIKDQSKTKGEMIGEAMPLCSKPRLQQRADALVRMIRTPRPVQLRAGYPAQKLFAQYYTSSAPMNVWEKHNRTQGLPVPVHMDDW